jgi:phage-related protein (TIGR01555 family)
MTLDELEGLYAENWVAAKVVDVMANEMTREWRDVNSPSLDPDQIKEFSTNEDALRVKLRFNKAIKWARLYGQSAILPVFKGTQSSLAEPLNLNEVKQGSLQFLNVIDGHDLQPSTYVTFNAFSPDYLEPQYYTIAGTTTRIHRSRLLVFKGREVPRRLSREHRYGGQPVLEVLYKAVINAATSSDITASLLHEANLDILSVTGLSQTLAAQGEETVKQRYEVFDYLKSVFNLVVVDSEEQFQNRTMNFSNLDKVIEIFYDIVAGATGIPPSKIVKRSSRSLGSEQGDEERQMFYDEVHGRQEEMLTDPIKKMDQILALHTWGEIPKDFTSTWNTLDQPNEKEEAETRLINAQAAQIYVSMNIVPEYVIARQLQQDNEYDNLDDEYINELEAAVKENLEENLLGGNEDGDEADTPEPEIPEQDEEQDEE